MIYDRETLRLQEKELPEGATGFIYIWYSKVKKWYYVGSHWLDAANKNYIASNAHLKRDYTKHPENFKRRIIYTHFGDHKSLYAEEQRWLDMIKPEELESQENRVAGTTRYYNIKKAAQGMTSEDASKMRQAYFDDPERSGEWRKQLAINIKNVPGMDPTGRLSGHKGKKMPQISAGIKLFYANRISTPEEKEIRRIANSKRTTQAWADGKYDNMKPAPPRDPSSYARGWKQSEYQKQRAREANKNKIISEETRKLILEKSLRKTVCPHCNLQGGISAMTRWHFDYCKHNPNRKIRTKKSET